MPLARNHEHQDISTIGQRRFYTTCVGISQHTRLFYDRTTSRTLASKFSNVVAPAFSPWAI
jgi:hypothetical protein